MVMQAAVFESRSAKHTKSFVKELNNEINEARIFRNSER